MGKINKIPFLFFFIFMSILGAGRLLLSAESTHVAGGVSFIPPGDWKEVQPSSQMRLFEFQIPKTEEDAGSIQLTVFHFGPNQGGTVDSNIERWKGQFTELSSDFPPEIKNRDTSNLKVTTAHMEGTYQSGMPMDNTGPQRDFAVLGAVVQGPNGLVFFKMTGSKTSVRSAKPGFESLIESLKTV